MKIIIIAISVVLLFILALNFTDHDSKKPNDERFQLTLFLCGDVMTGRGVDQAFPESVDPAIYERYVKDARDYVKLAEEANGNIPQPVPYSYIWGDAMETWQNVNPAFKIINLETSITDNEAPWPGKGINYRMHPANAEALTRAEIDVVSLANNHTLDWGRKGLAETLRTLQNAEIKYAGAGRSAEEAEEPAILNHEKGRILVFAYGSPTSGVPSEWAASQEQSGVNYLPELSDSMVSKIGHQIAAIKRENDAVIFSVHWGSNWGYNIPEQQKEFARHLIDRAGVDLIHGHSSHHPRGIEVYKNKLIIYGAGDFINDYEGISGYEMFRDDLTLMYFPRIDLSNGNLISMKMVPLQIRNFQLHHAKDTDAQWLRQVIDRESEKLGANVVMNEDRTYSLKW